MKALTVVMATAAIVILMAGCNSNSQHEERADMAALPLLSPPLRL